MKDFGVSLAAVSKRHTNPIQD